MTVPRPAPRLILLTALALLAFAGNSLLCRFALRGGHADPAAFTLIRLASGAAALWMVLKVRRVERLGGSWPSALALFVYAIAFSFAYMGLSAGTGALLLFGAAMIAIMNWRPHGLLARREPSLRLPPEMKRAKPS